MGDGDLLDRAAGASEGRDRESADGDRGVVRVGGERPDVVAEFDHLPFRRRAFAGVLCDGTIDAVADDHLAMSELGRVLRRDGVAVISAPNRHGLGVLRRKLNDRMRGRHHPAAHYFQGRGQRREYTWVQLEELARTSLLVRSRLVAPSGRAPSQLIVRAPGGYRVAPRIVLLCSPR
jgi:SAM-dependent methyltransferase